MFQTNTNCEDSLNVWNFNSLKSLLKIPQDQLNLLKNIPGWSNTDPSAEKTASHLENKKLSPIQNSFVEENANLKANSSSNENIGLIKSKKVTSLSNNSIVEDLYNKYNLNEKYPLRKSQSIDSIDKLQPISNLSVSKRTSSIPNMANMLSLSSSSYSGKQQDAFCGNSDKISILGDKIGNTGASIKDINIMKSQFMDSGVQCQMSQSSQQNLDISLSKRIGFASNSTLSHNFVSSALGSETVLTQNIENFQAASKVSDSPLNEKVDDVENSALILPTSDRNCLLIQEKPKDDESFISLPIPCAQPHTNADELVLNKPIPISTANSNVPINSLRADPLSKGNIHVSLGKRKRRADPDKVSKKVRSMKNIEVQYSEDQIKSMLHIVKILNGL